MVASKRRFSLSGETGRFVIAGHNIAMGMALGVDPRPPTSKTFIRSDRRAFADDWAKIGKDLKDTVKSVARERRK